MGLMDKIFDRDDENEKKRKAAAAPSSAPRGDAPRADFSDVSGASSTTAPAAGAASSASRRSYTVAAGDSLSRIAQREYGDASKWRAIYEANRDSIKDPDLIHPGQVLTLPANP
ncbi:MAG TPA: LysM peptidoglycan-binding domain-containing protein [Gemmatimonadales bacterium]